MPELPEVETLCGQLRGLVVGKRIDRLTIVDDRIGPLPSLSGSFIRTVARSGKELVLELDDGRALYIHLRMTGRLQWHEHREDLLPHTRAVLIMEGGRLDLIDVRRFATLSVRTKGLCALPSAENDPLKGLDVHLLEEKAKNKKLPIKSFLLDQRLLAGMGNIYACEVLHLAAIDPTRPSGELLGSEWARIAFFLPSVLSRSVACRGTTVSDWRDLFGRPGEYQHHLQVYGREGEPCYRCGEVIRRIKIGGRGTYFCPRCQH